MIAPIDVPFDITEIIIAELELEDDSNYSSLKACALISKNFWHSVRPYLFHTIEIVVNAEDQDGSKEIAKYKRFESILIKSPEIGKYVKELIIDGYSKGDYSIYKQETLPRVLGLLNRISLLKLQISYDLSGHPGQIPWRTLDLPLQEALETIIDLPTLDYLAIHSFANVPLSSMRSMIRIEDVTLTNMSFSYECDHTTTSQSLSCTETQSGIYSLNALGMASSDLKPFIKYMKMANCNLKELWVNSANFTATGMIMENHKKSITSLIFPRELWHYNAPLLKIGQLPNLRSISVTPDIAKPLPHLGSRSNPLWRFLAMLRMPSDGNHIEEIIIRLDHYTYFHMTPPTDRLEWHNMDVLLSGSKYESLKVLYIVTPSDSQYVDPGAPDGAQEREILRTQLLPMVHEKALLNICTSDPW